MGRIRFNKRRAMWSVALCCLGILIGFLIYCYNHDMIWVRLKLRSVAGIRNIELHGFDRGDHYHIYGVGFGIVGKPGSAILVHVYDTDQGLTNNPDHLFLSQIGPWAFTSGAGSVGDKTMTKDEPVESSYSASWIDIGPKGEFGGTLPLKVRDINDLVAHYDQLVPFFASWPDEEHKRELVHSSGKRVGYYRERVSRYPRYPDMQ